MATITISDLTSEASIDVDDASLLGKSQIVSLTSGTSQFVGELSETLSNVTFSSAALGVTFQAPTINIDASGSLQISAGTNGALTMYREADSPLLGDDPAVPAIEIEDDQYWLSFELDTTFELAAGLSDASGFGVTIDHSVGVTLSCYTLCDQSQILKSALSQTLGNFAALCSAADVRNQHPGTVLICDTAGTLKVSGFYSFPIFVNQLSLASAAIPFKVVVNPSLAITVTGAVALTGEHSIRSWKKSASELVLAIYKQKGTTWSASFDATAGVLANAGNTDLIGTFFSAVAPGIDLTKAGLTQNDPNYAAVSAVLQQSIDRNLAISVNGSCSASLTDEAAFVYSIDLIANPILTDSAINKALHGDWTGLQRLPNVKELKNVVGQAREAKATLTVNLLGIFNYQSVEDFILSSTIMKCAEDGSVTVTDKATAANISAASTPYAADADKLRRALDEATITTAAYSIAAGNFNFDLHTNQNLLICQDSMGSSSLKKLLLLAPAIGLKLTGDVKSPKPRHVLLEASQTLDAGQATAMFFTDPVHRVPRGIPEVTKLGRNTLASLLDPTDRTDASRIAILKSDSAWSQMDQQQFPWTSCPAAYTDWYAITFWATAVHRAGIALRDLLATIDRIARGSDPLMDSDFLNKRAKLARALGEVTRDSQAAFESDWAIAITYALAGGNTKRVLTCAWDGVQHMAELTNEELAGGA